MISALEERGLEYILGTRERGDVRVREIVLENEKPFTPLLIECSRGDTQLFVKEVSKGGVHYNRLPQRSGSREGSRRPAGHRRRAPAAAEAGRQGTDRQHRLSPLPAPLGRRRRLRDRCRQTGREGPL